MSEEQKTKIIQKDALQAERPVLYVRSRASKHMRSRAPHLQMGCVQKGSSFWLRGAEVGREILGMLKICEDVDKCRKK